MILGLKGLPPLEQENHKESAIMDPNCKQNEKHPLHSASNNGRTPRQFGLGDLLCATCSSSLSLYATAGEAERDRVGDLDCTGDCDLERECERDRDLSRSFSRFISR